MTKKIQILFLFTVCILSFQCSTFSKEPSRASTSEQESYEVWAGLQDSTSEPKHKAEMDKSWAIMLDRKREIKSFLDSKSYESTRGTVVYPFSGIDVLNLFTFYPKSKK